MRISDWSSDVCSSDLVVVDEYDKYWAEESDKAKLGEQAYAEFRGTVDGLFAEAEALAAAGGPDAALGDLLPANHRWRPAIEAICSWSSGARLDQISAVDLGRSEERRVGKECVSPCRSRWSPAH